MIGLPRGTVELCNHETEWEENAAYTIRKLKQIFGAAASDIQHVGSTSIVRIKAKPIIDIVVAVRSFEDVTPLVPVLEANGFLRRHWETADQLLFACGDYSRPAGIQTHFIHVVKMTSPEWRDYINFRDYLNAKPAVAKEYETLKVELAGKYKNGPGREKYLEGKRSFILQTLRKALVWSYLGKTVTVTVDRPAGSVHPKHSELIYPINYGYIKGVLGGDGEDLDVYVFGVTLPINEFTGRVVAIVHRENDIEDKLVAAPLDMKPNQAEITEAIGFQEKYFITRLEYLYHKSCGMIVFRSDRGVREYLLLHEAGANVWSFPKGHMEAGETEMQTVIREVKEEAGLAPKVIDGFKEEISYKIAPIYEKTVVLFLAESAEKVMIKRDEIADYRWADIKNAKSLLKHKFFADVLDKAEVLEKLK